MVLPRRYPLPPIELPGGAAFKITGETNTNAIGNSGEFVGLRDYRPGDPLRQIHWKSWARTGRPIVKELEDTFYPRYGLVLDTLCDRPHRRHASRRPFPWPPRSPPPSIPASRCSI